MKKTILVVFITTLILGSCKRKTYVCECTDNVSGEKSYGDNFKGELQKQSAQVACDELASKFDTTSTCKLITR